MSAAEKLERSSTLSVGTHILVGDVGGTHARFAVVDASGPPPWRIQDRQDLAEPFPTFIDALRSYFERTPAKPKPPVAAIAVAGPVNAGTARFTNRGWEISESDLKSFGFKQAILVNDFEALAFAAEVLVDEDLSAIGPNIKGREQGTITILGPGTGFGVSCLARYDGRSVPMATEGGHMGFAPSDEAELAALQAMWKEKGRVSVERILSGSGLENLYATLERLAGREPRSLSAADISTQAMQQDAGCHAALTMFCSIFGAVAGDLALAHGARGGVYISGGITQKIQKFLVDSPFRRRFEDKGRLSSFVQAVPTKLIVNPDVAMIGAARAGVTIASL
jgi:glucokinase